MPCRPARTRSRGYPRDVNASRRVACRSSPKTKVRVGVVARPRCPPAQRRSRASVHIARGRTRARDVNRQTPCPGRVGDERRASCAGVHPLSGFNRIRRGMGGDVRVVARVASPALRVSPDDSFGTRGAFRGWAPVPSSRGRYVIERSIYVQKRTCVNLPPVDMRCRTTRLTRLRFTLRLLHCNGSRQVVHVTSSHVRGPVVNRCSATHVRVRDVWVVWAETDEDRSKRRIYVQVCH
jgi:hypothetical protein